ncbi:XRE family transcriptional regulator [Chitinispirillales bacterium ANBcel5]|uniref:helix-turn-helix domain-containing protein n=1 Tax=Cellulosispirillum alkaliphilum TaxID=3039283 RepID=UPI002A53D438|nr:XRE family transcriptional regulator [Chitinispirillales bacterium ANBcel5]
MNEEILKQFRPRMGRMLKLFREKNNRSQGDVAAQAGISTSMLSQIERGIVSPSIDTLVLVCHSLGLDPSELFRGLNSKEPVNIHRPKERLSIEQHGIRYEQLITSSNGAFQSELFLLEAAPGASSTLSENGHEGVEMGYVLEGSAFLEIGEEQHQIKQGDSISFLSYLPHILHNKAKQWFRAVWSISPPHVDYFNDNSELIST